MTELETTSLERALSLSKGEKFGLDDSEIVTVLASAERKMRRAFKPSEAHFFSSALEARAKHLAKLAGNAPKFESAMYGDTASRFTRDTNDENEA